MEFLYFPDNKLEYIPAVISCMLFFIGAVATLYVFKKVSRKELEQVEGLEHHLTYGKKEEDETL